MSTDRGPSPPHYSPTTDLDKLFSNFRVTESIHIDAPQKTVWELITDITRIVGFSPECVKVEWLNGATAPGVDARFSGTSRIGTFEWTRNCTITALEEPTLFAYEVADESDEAPQSRWRFEINPDGTGSVVRQRFSHVSTGRSTVRLMAEEDPSRAEALVAERTVMLSTGMRQTLEAIRDVLEERRQSDASVR